jgi:hypothetical protein
VTGQHIADVGDAAVFAADHGEPLQRKGQTGTISQKTLAAAVPEAVTLFRGAVGIGGEPVAGPSLILERL